jgi:hypothetical protein
MNHRLSLFALSTLRVHAAAAIYRRAACNFSYHSSAPFDAVSFSSGAGNVSNIPASISHQLNFRRFSSLWRRQRFSTSQLKPDFRSFAPS